MAAEDPMPVVVWRHRHGKYRHDKRRADERRKGRLSHRATRDTRGGCWEKVTIGGIEVDGGCSLDMINPILRGWPVDGLTGTALIGTGRV